MTKKRLKGLVKQPGKQKKKLLVIKSHTTIQYGYIYIRRIDSYIFNKKIIYFLFVHVLSI